VAHEQATIHDGTGIRLGALAGRLTGLGLVLACAGLGLACYLGFGRAAVGGGAAEGITPRAIFFHAYLVAFLFFLSITLGALFFVLLHHLARAGWSVTLRRLAEALAGNVVLMLPLALPLLAGRRELYEWLEPGVTQGDKILAGKAAYLNEHALLLRFAIYFAVWIFLAWYFRSSSIKQDQTGDIALSRRMEKLSAPGMIALGFTLSFAAIDLLMSLNPHWFSTIFGVYFYAGAVVSFLAIITLLARWLQNSGRLRDVVSTEHYHDLGKLTFTFTIFWGYIAFSQYMLIWYANMPEETQFFIPRQLGPWAAVSLVLLFCHLLIPFVGMLSRHAKRGLGVLAFWAVWMLMAHLLDLYWLVMPNLYIRRIPEAVAHVDGGSALPLTESLARLVVSNQHVYDVGPAYQSFAAQINAPPQAPALLMTLGLVLGLGGLYLVSTAWLLRGPALVPMKDPRLPEALSFENM
jgi:hypothetical protein